MDFNIIWKCMIVFNFFAFLIWVSIFTYRGDFMGNNDFVDKDGNRTGRAPDRHLSFAGRSLVFLTAIISSVILTILFFILYDNYIKPTIKCKKGAKNLKECKLIKK